MLPPPPPPQPLTTLLPPGVPTAAAAVKGVSAEARRSPIAVEPLTVDPPPGDTGGARQASEGVAHAAGDGNERAEAPAAARSGLEATKKLVGEGSGAGASLAPVAVDATSSLASPPRGCRFQPAGSCRRTPRARATAVAIVTTSSTPSVAPTAAPIAAEDDEAPPADVTAAARLEAAAEGAALGSADAPPPPPVLHDEGPSSGSTPAPTSTTPPLLLPPLPLPLLLLTTPTAGVSWISAAERSPKSGSAHK